MTSCVHRRNKGKWQRFMCKTGSASCVRPASMRQFFFVPTYVAMIRFPWLWAVCNHRNCKSPCKYMGWDTIFYCHNMYYYIAPTKHCCNTNLAIATIQFFVAICTTLLQHRQLLHTTKHIHCNIDMQSQPSTKALQYHLSIATPIKLPAMQIKSWQHWLLIATGSNWLIELTYCNDLHT